MPFAIEIFPARMLGAVAFTGMITPVDIAAALEKLCGHDDWEPGHNELWALYGIDGIIATPANTDTFLEESERQVSRLGSGRSAVVVRSEIVLPYVYVLQIHTRESGREQRIFRQLDDALAWLDGTGDDLEAVKEWVTSAV